MHAVQQPYRDLYESILDYEGSELYADVVKPWLHGVDGERRWLESFAGREGSPVPGATIEDLWRLYALSRIIDLLQLSFSPAPVTPETWRTQPVRAGEYAEFMDTFGLQRVEPRPFHPFFHEVVTVQPGSGEPAVVHEYWPAYMLGPLLMTRAGCTVAADWNRDIAEKSALYWAFARRNRRAEDLSKGWGSNSQWRTEFRRDYLLNGTLHYNVDAKPRRADQDEDLDQDERLELLRHRCFVTCTKSDLDRWPYTTTFVEALA